LTLSVLLGPARPLSRLHWLATLIAARHVVLLPTSTTALPALPLAALLRLICHLGLSFSSRGKIAECTAHRVEQPVSHRLRAKSTRAASPTGARLRGRDYEKPPTYNGDAVVNSRRRAVFAPNVETLPRRVLWRQAPGSADFRLHHSR
jgi:hypothetical protein